MAKTHSGAAPRRTQDPMLDGKVMPAWLLAFPFVVIAIVHIIGVSFPTYVTWGFNAWAELPRWQFVLALGLLGLVIIRPISDTVDSFFRSLWSAVRVPIHHLPGWALTALVACGLFALAMVLRSRALVYGDGFIAVNNTTLPLKLAFAGIHDYLKPLSVLIYQAGYALFTTLAKQSPEVAFAATSAAGGVVGWFGLAKLCASLTDRNDHRIFLFAASISSGCIFLFLGHIELYVWGCAGFLWCLYFCQRYAAGQSGSGTVVSSATVTLLFNLMMLPAILTMLAIMVLLRTPSGGRKPIAGLTPGRLTLLVSLASVAMAALLQVTGTSYGTVILLPKEDNAYWFLSAGHLIDMANILVFAAPLGLALIVFWFPKRIGKTFDLPLLMAASAVLFAVTFWIDPSIGAVRDWDLLSQFGLPLTVLSACLFVRLVSRARDVSYVTVMAFALALFLAYPLAVERLDPVRAATRIDRILWDDPHYQVSYFDGIRGNAWGTILQNDVDQGNLALRHLQRAVEANPSDHQVLYNIGVVFYKKPQYDSAASYFRRAVALSPDDQKYRTWWSNSLDLSGRPDEALQVLTLTSNTGAERAEFHRTKGILFAKQKRFQDALSEFRFAHGLAPLNIEENVNLGMVHDELERIDSAEYYYRRSLSMSSGEMRCFVRSNLLGMLIKQRDFRRAAPELQIYRKECPTASDLRQFETAIQNSPKR